MSQPLISFSHSYKSFNSVELFNAISLSINAGEILGVIGLKGSGKSTLLEILANEKEFDVGQVDRLPGLKTQFVPKAPIYELDVCEYCEIGFYDDLDLLTDFVECIPENLEEWSLELEIFVDQTVDELCKFVDLPNESLTQGMQSRVALSKALIAHPNLLLLDEPTHYLNKDMLDFFQKVLKKRRGATVVVSENHDFLNAICTRIIAIREKKLISFKGNYNDYLNEWQLSLQRDMEALKVAQE